MSLSALAIRACAFLALYNRTMAGDRMFDSAVTPIDALSDEVSLPFITVSIDEAHGKDRSRERGHDLLSSVDSVVLVIEAAVGRVVSIEISGGTEQVEVQLPPSTAGYEWALDILSYQIMRQFSTGTLWGDLLRRFILSVHDVGRVRGGGSNGGTKFSARQIVFEVEPIGDPTFGEPLEPGSVWADFLAALRAIDDSDPELVDYRDLADAIEETITATGDVPSWLSTASRLGLPTGSYAGLGLAPVVTDAGLVTALATFGAPVDAAAADEMLGPVDG